MAGLAATSFYWQGCAEGDAIAADRPLRELLRSGETVAMGIALDQIQRSWALSRFGGDVPYEDFEQEVLECARTLLRQPPTPAELSPYTGEGANHASALNAMMNIARAEDCGLIADVLERTSNPNVREAVASAAGAALSCCDDESAGCGRLVGLIGTFADDPRLPVLERARLLGALDRAPGATATALRDRGARFL
ncbi:hypothetical protein GCM10010191_36080 [Actinomadura vinacea]|uniref:HEAT repeat domain-containing protein n=1 Tax=Actinomadura vinacea TaxID=115336 RepID=A0ABN3J3B1_9ACTN